jgi:hypothetical protein
VIATAVASASREVRILDAGVNFWVGAGFGSGGFFSCGRVW